MTTPSQSRARDLVVLAAVALAAVITISSIVSIAAKLILKLL